MLLSKLDVDVLVQVVVHGPKEAEWWASLADDPDGLGAELWALNRSAAAYEDEDGPVPAYAFTPLPCGITAAEGVKQIDFYRYQSRAEDGPWTTSAVPELLEDLRERLLGKIAEIHAAPWGWGPDDVEARRDRPTPATPEPSARVLEVGWQCAEVGVPLDDTNGVPGRHGLADPRAVLGGGFWMPPLFTGFVPFGVAVLTDEDLAREVFLRSVHQAQGTTHPDRIHRIGDVVITVGRAPGQPEVDRHVEAAVAALAAPDRLGPPDESWASAEAPTAVVPAAVLATRVLLDPATAGTHLAESVHVARTPAEQADLVALLADDEARAAVAAVSTDEHSIVLVRGLADVARASEAVLRPHVEVDRETGPRRTHQLTLHTEGATCGYASVLVVGHLPRPPQRAVIEDPGYRRVLGVGPLRPRG